MKAKLFKLVGLLTLLVSVQTMAQHNHEDEHEGWPENILLALEGQDAISKDECLLFVTDVGYTGPEQTAEQFYAVVQTNYAHGADQAAPMTVKAVSGKPNVLMGTGTNGKDQIAIFLNSSDLDLNQITSFNLKWLHGSHYHTNRCVNMVVHEHEDEDHDHNHNPN